MSFGAPNLARDPFANVRPVRRAAAALWLVALLLLGWNAAAYLRSGVGAADRAAQLDGLRRSTAQARARTQTLEADLRRADLARVNAHTAYLNQRIDERAFSWNLLLDRLAETLPRGVRVVRLAPEAFKDDRRAREEVAPPPEERQVRLQVSGEAEDDESLLRFVDALFAHPAFDRPSLARENRSKTGILDFSISVAYRPEAEAGARSATTAGSDGAPTRPTGTAHTAAAVAAGRAPAATGTIADSPLPISAPLAARAGTAGPPPAGRGNGAPGASRAGVPETPGGARESLPEASAETGVPTDSRQKAVARAPAAPASPSIFGAPFDARPYASGGGR